MSEEPMTGDGHCLVHGTAVSLGGRAILLIGAPGCGKSDLALRLIEAGATLIADDAVRIIACDEPQTGRCRAESIPAGDGLLMVRSIGIIRIDTSPPHAQAARLAMVIRLDDPALRTDAADPRLGTWSALPGRPVPLISLAPFETSTVAKVKLALQRWGL
jgi:serine kinase of HPr protein (carbohydrate metabolism regulator)